MLRYIAQRLFTMVVTLFVVSIIVFVLIELPPGDYAERFAYRKFSSAGQAVTESDLENLRVQFGLDRPLHERYVIWITDIVTRGYFGESFLYNVPVTNVIGDRIWITLGLGFMAIIITYSLAIAIGIFSALYRHTLPDYLATIIGYIGLALPNFMLALVLLYLSVTLLDSAVGGLFSQEYIDAPWSWGKFLDLLGHLWIPAFVIGTGNTAYHLQTMRASLLDELNQLYVTAARARGIPEWKLIFKYPVRMALNPIISYAGFDLANIFSSAPVVALVLGIQEASYLQLEAFIQQDTYLGGAILLIATVFIVAGVLMSDLALAALDPRIRFGRT